MVTGDIQTPVRPTTRKLAANASIVDESRASVSHPKKRSRLSGGRALPKVACWRSKHDLSRDCARRPSRLSVCRLGPLALQEEAEGAGGRLLDRAGGIRGRADGGPGSCPGRLEYRGVHRPETRTGRHRSPPRPDPPPDRRDRSRRLPLDTEGLGQAL